MPNWTTTAADGEVDIRLEAEGPGSWEPKTVFQVRGGGGRQAGRMEVAAAAAGPPASSREGRSCCIPVVVGLGLEPCYAPASYPTGARRRRRGQRTDCLQAHMGSCDGGSPLSVGVYSCWRTR